VPTKVEQINDYLFTFFIYLLIYYVNDMTCCVTQCRYHCDFVISMVIICNIVTALVAMRWPACHMREKAALHTLYMQIDGSYYTCPGDHRRRLFVHMELLANIGA